MSRQDPKQLHQIADALYERYGKPLEEAHWGEYVVISPDGKRTTAVVDASTARLDKSTDNKNGCPLKLRKLSTMTLTYLGNKAEYVPTLCKVAALHPRDPKNPEPGSACK